MRLLILILITFISSCSSKKDIILIQDSNPATAYNYEFKNIKIQPDDILRIKISSKSINLATLYTENQIIQPATNLLTYKIQGYLVDSMDL